ncbi:MAG: hypothetical protein ABIP93_08675 [Gemmatimonadaceae bacterium]
MSTRLVGVADGTYNFTINPTVDQVVTLGPNRLELPAYSVCGLGVSGYGASWWDIGCNPQRRSFTLTVTVRNASTSYASIDFQPAMRFNPTTSVSLHFYVPDLTAANATTWNILYCASANSQPGKRYPTGGQTAGANCVNEALTDPSLATKADYGASMLSRRIKHFSSYMVDGGYLVTD